jgi:Ca2+-binding RTX toxin-like protein
MSWNRRVVARIGALALGLAGATAVAWAAPAFSLTPPLCSVINGVLTVDLYAPDDPWGGQVTVNAVIGSALDQAGQRVVTVGLGMNSPSPQVCQADGADIRTSDLTSIVVERDHSSGKIWGSYNTSITIDLAGRFLANEATTTSGVPIRVNAWPQDALTLVDTTGQPAIWRGLTASSLLFPFDLDEDGSPELFIDTSDDATGADPSTNHTFMALSVYTGSGNDSVDLSDTPLPSQEGVRVDSMDGNDDLVTPQSPSPAYPTWSTILQGGSGNDTLVGGPNADLLNGGDGDDIIGGGNEDDRIAPGAGADTVDSGPGGDLITLTPDGSPDVITAGTEQDALSVGMSGDWISPFVMTADGVANDGQAGEGDNLGAFHGIHTGYEPDYIDATPATGGSVYADMGDDHVVMGAGPNNIDLGDGRDTIDFSKQPSGVDFNGAQAKAVVDGQTSNIYDVEDVIGSQYADQLLSTYPGATLRPGLGADQVSAEFVATFVAEPGADGADTVVGPPDSVVDYSLRTTPVSLSADSEANDGGAGEGDDINVGSGSTWVGGSGADALVGSTGTDYLLGNGGNDVLNGRGGSDNLWGGSGQNSMYGGAGPDQLLGGDGNDRLYGGTGEDVLQGGAGNDQLDGGLGDDDEYGGLGDDTFTEGSSAADNGSDLLDGGTGLDGVSYLGRTAGVTISNDGSWNDGAAGEGDGVAPTIERLVGTNAADTLTGGSGSDWLYGHGGADVLTGGSGSDWLYGGATADRIYGDAGSDTIYARDNTKDALNGGTGVDKARRDKIDTVVMIEASF